MSDPNAPNQFIGGSGERPDADPSQYGQPGSYGPAGVNDPYGRPPNPSQPMTSNPYGPGASYGTTQPSGPYQPYQSGDYSPQGDPNAPTYVPAPSGGYPQPGAPSGGYPQYQQPAPSGGYPQQGQSGAYGQPVAPGQTNPYGQQQQYGQYGQYGQYAPYSQTLASSPVYAPPGTPTEGYPQAGVAPAAPPKRSRTGMIVGIVAAVVIVALLAGGAGYYFLSYLPMQARAQVTSVARGFCDDLTTQNYVSAYEATGSALHSKYTQTLFTQDFAALDKAEGAASACSGSLSFTYGNSTATYATTLTRSTSGPLQGALHLKQEGGTWKVDAIDTALLGVNLEALQTELGYCSALEQQDYTTAYSYLDSSVQASTSQTDYTNTENLHDQINGKVTACTVTSIGTPNDDTQATMTVSITRANLAAQTGTVTLTNQGSKWTISQLATSAEGEDVGPYMVGQQYCADISAGNYSAAYSLTAADFQALVTEAQFAAGWQPVSGVTVEWSCGKPDLSTYQVSGSSASYDFLLTATVPGGGSNSQTAKLLFSNDGTSWKVEGYPQNP